MKKLIFLFLILSTGAFAETWRAFIVGPDGNTYVLERNGTDWRVVCFKPGGARNGQFGVRGAVNLPSLDSYEALAVADDGAVYVLGKKNVRNGVETYVARIVNRALDPRFGENGLCKVHEAVDQEVPRIIQIDRQGRFMIVFQKDVVAELSTSFVIRYNSSGTRDNTFNEGRRVSIPRLHERAVIQAISRITVTDNNNLLMAILVFRRSRQSALQGRRQVLVYTKLLTEDGGNLEDVFHPVEVERTTPWDFAGACSVTRDGRFLVIVRDGGHGQPVTVERVPLLEGGQDRYQIQRVNGRLGMRSEFSADAVVIGGTGEVTFFEKPKDSMYGVSVGSLSPNGARSARMIHNAVGDCGDIMGTAFGGGDGS